MTDYWHFSQPCGTPYTPSNGTEGEIFHSMWCYKCARYGGVEPGDNPPCEIQGRALFYYIEEIGYPTEWIYGRDGQPMCTAFTEDENEPIWYDGDDQLKLFGAPRVG